MLGRRSGSHVAVFRYGDVAGELWVELAAARVVVVVGETGAEAHSTRSVVDTAAVAAFLEYGLPAILGGQRGPCL